MEVDPEGRLGLGVPVRRSGGDQRHPPAAPAGGVAVHRGTAGVHAEAGWQPVPDRQRLRRRSGRGPPLRSQQQPHPQPDDQPGFRPGRGRPVGGQSVGLRDFLLGASAVLPGGRQHLPVRSERHQRWVRAALLLATHRTCAAGVGGRARWLRRHAGGHDDPGRGQALGQDGERLVDRYPGRFDGGGESHSH